MSERHLRRVFREAVGVSPKQFARLVRFERAVSAAHGDIRASWADIAAATGYYDQAHLIGEFHAISGVTPRALLDELVRGQDPPEPEQRLILRRRQSGPPDAYHP